MNTVLRTNSKQVTASRAQYILDAIDGQPYDRTLATDAERIQFLADTFKAEMWDNNPNEQRKGKQAAFIGWMQGLPSSFNVDYENHRILDIAKEWQTLAPDATEKQEDAVLRNWWSFLYMGIHKLMQQHNINF